MLAYERIERLWSYNQGVKKAMKLKVILRGRGEYMDHVHGWSKTKKGVCSLRSTQRTKRQTRLQSSTWNGQF